MSIQSRDKKILMGIVPVLIVFGFWFLILSPKRAESGRLGAQLTKVQAKRDSAVAAAGKLQGARNSYAADYATVVRLGKAVPASLDMPSLLVQLESAAKGTNIDFDSVKAGVRTAAPTTPAPSTSGSTSGGSGSSTPPPAASGGAPAQTGAGKATEKAGDAKNTADQSTAASSSAASGSSANTGGAAPASGTPATGTPATGTPATGAQAPGLDSVPLEFTFTGGFFDLADFFHRMKRFVHLANERIRVQGRLITIDSLDFTTDTFPELSASVKATVYLSPKNEGTTAGATPAGPQTTPASAPAGSPAPTQSTSTPPTSGAP